MTEYQEMAVLIVKNYLNTLLSDEEIFNKYELAVNHIAYNIENKSSLDNVQSYTEGKQSITFKSGGDSNSNIYLDELAKSLLPNLDFYAW